MRKIRWGILSTARIAHPFAEDFAHVENGVLTAVASRSPDTAGRFAARHGIATAYSSYEQLYKDPDIDAIYIATPNTLHVGNATDALRAGKAVLCEKPLTMSLQEIDALTDVARKSGGYLMEAMWTWFLPAIRQAAEWFETGQIGRLIHLRADFGHPLPYSADNRAYNVELGGGVVPDMGIYPIAIFYLFTRRDPIDVDVVARHAPNGVEDDVSAIFDYGDLTATLSTSFRCHLANSAYIVGDKGYIEIPNFWCAKECHLYRGNEKVESFNDERSSHGYNYETTAVGDDLLQGRQESAVAPLSTSRSFQEHIEAIRAHC